jgi:glycerol-3-phosphate dehydrogenase
VPASGSDGVTRETTVLVVGGGATGVGVARDLAMRGVDVTLVERGGLGGGTSGRSHGLLHSGARYADTDPEDAAECAAENRILRDIAGACIEPTGGLFVQTAEDDPNYFERKLEACREAGIDAVRVPVADARADEPSLSEAAERVFRVPDAAIYPSRLVAATAADAREHGATIRTHAAVRTLLEDSGRVVGADVEGVGRIEADHVVNATGAWADELAGTADIDLEMQPTKGAMVVLDYPDVDTVLNRCRPASDGDIVVPHEDTAVLGTTSVDVDHPDDPIESDDEVERVLSECADLLDVVTHDHVERAYWGVRPLYSPRSYGENARAISRGFYLLDHAERDDSPGLTTIVGGKLTTYRLMAEATADHVVERLGVDEPCRTAEEPLVGSEDPELLDAYVDEFDAHNPADAEVVGK